MNGISTINSANTDAHLDGKIDQMRMMSFKNPGTMSEKQMKEAADQFEGMMFRMLIKEMRKTVPHEDGLFSESKSSQMYMDIVDDHLADELAKSNSLGIDTIIYNDLKERNENFQLETNKDDNGFMELKDNNQFMELNPTTETFMQLHQDPKMINLPKNEPFKPLSKQPSVSSSQIMNL